MHPRHVQRLAQAGELAAWHAGARGQWRILFTDEGMPAPAKKKAPR